MKKFVVSTLMGFAVCLVAATPARAIEPLAASAAILTVMVIGPSIANDLVRAGKLPAAPPACRTEKVKAENGNYYFEVVSKDNPSNCR